MHSSVHLAEAAITDAVQDELARPKPCFFLFSTACPILLYTQVDSAGAIAHTRHRTLFRKCFRQRLAAELHCLPGRHAAAWLVCVAARTWATSNLALLLVTMATIRGMNHDGNASHLSY
eukprot:3222208-Amphidinium_carterae.1